MAVLHSGHESDKRIAEFEQSTGVLESATLLANFGCFSILRYVRNILLLISQLCFALPIVLYRPPYKDTTSTEIHTSSVDAYRTLLLRMMKRVSMLLES